MPDMTVQDSIVTRAYGKINLGLKILGKRDDGYHEIETVLHRINIYDEITVVLRKSNYIEITCSQPDIPADNTNLCHTAAKLFYDTIQSTPSISIDISKGIPVGAGLGGGSADAAAVLNACNFLNGNPLDSYTLSRLAADIGSDVPYFLGSGTALAKGRGELLEYFTLSVPYWIVVVYPSIKIQTKWAYESILPYISQDRNNIAPDNAWLKTNLKSLICGNIKEPEILLKSLRNDFESLIFCKHPEIMRLKEALLKGGADFALMSGSGSSLFGLFNDERKARVTAAALSENADVWITPPFFSPDILPGER